MAGGRTTLLHHIFQRTGRLPSEIMALPAWERELIFASMRITLEAEHELTRS